MISKVEVERFSLTSSSLVLLCYKLLIGEEIGSLAVS